MFTQCGVRHSIFSVRCSHSVVWVTADSVWDAHTVWCESQQIQCEMLTQCRVSHSRFSVRCSHSVVWVTVDSVWDAHTVWCESQHIFFHLTPTRCQESKHCLSNLSNLTAGRCVHLYLLSCTGGGWCWHKYRQEILSCTNIVLHRWRSMLTQTQAGNIVLHKYCVAQVEVDVDTHTGRKYCLAQILSCTNIV